MTLQGTTFHVLVHRQEPSRSSHRSNLVKRPDGVSRFMLGSQISLSSLQDLSHHLEHLCKLFLSHQLRYESS